MAPRKPQDDDEMDEEEDYASAEDSDFAPDDAPERDVSSAESEDELADPTVTPIRRQISAAKRPERIESKVAAGKAGDANDLDFENSGDEAIIGKANKKNAKRKRNGVRFAPDAVVPADEDEEPHVVKTRSMHAVEKAERKTQFTPQGPVTVNVDDLWAQMLAAPVIPNYNTKEDAPADLAESSLEPLDPAHTLRDLGQDRLNQAPQEPSSMIKIKRTYNFAGKVHTEEKLVARDSAEARLYLASHPEAAAIATSAGDGENHDTDKRMPRKAFRSKFEPNFLDPTTQQPTQRADLNLGLSARLQARQEAGAKKLNTVEKSRMDWAGFVDKEGIQDELDLAGRSKDSYAVKRDFLARADARLEEDARRARMLAAPKK